MIIKAADADRTMDLDIKELHNRKNGFTLFM